MSYPYNATPYNNPSNIAVPNPVNVIFSPRDPNPEDDSYPPGTEWQNTQTKQFFKLYFPAAGNASWSPMSPGTLAGVSTLEGNSGGKISPDGTGNIQILGTPGQINVDGTPNTLTLSLADGQASINQLKPNLGANVVPAALGVVNVDQSTSTYTDGTTANVLKVEVQAPQNALVVGAGIHVPVSTIPAIAQVGQPLVSDGINNPPKYANNLNVNAGGTGAVSFTPNAVVCGGPLNNTDALQSVAGLGTAGQVLTSSGAGLPTWQDIPASGGGISKIKPDAGIDPVEPDINGEVSFAGAITTYATGALNALKTEVQGPNHALLVGKGANTPISSVAASATVGQPVVSQGAAADPIYGTASVAGGGTGAIAFANVNSLLLSGTTTTSSLTSLASGTAGQVLTSAGAGVAPTWSTVTPGTGGISSLKPNLGADVVATGLGQVNVNASSTTFTDGSTANTLKTEVQGPNHAVLIGKGTNVAASSIAASATVGQPLTSQGGTADPAYSNLNVNVGGTGVTSFNVNRVVLGGATTNGPLQQVASSGTAGQVLTSTGTGLPTWQDVPASGGGISKIVVDAGTTPVVPDVNGQISLAGATSTYITGALNAAKIEVQGPNHAVLLGKGANTTINSVSPTAITRIPLVSMGVGGDPEFNTCGVAGGGTGKTSFNEYSVLCGGIAPNGPLQQVAGQGTAGQVLTSAGPNALPIWAAGGGGGSTKAPTMQTFLTPGSGTYVLPQNPKPLYLQVMMVGGGASGCFFTQQSTTPPAPIKIPGNSGGNSLFGTQLIAYGGIFYNEVGAYDANNPNLFSNLQKGGSASLGGLPGFVYKAYGVPFYSTALVSGGYPSQSFFGGNAFYTNFFQTGAGTQPNPFIQKYMSALPNTGGVGAQQGPSLTAGAFIPQAGGFLVATIANPDNTYTYTVGSGGAAITQSYTLVQSGTTYYYTAISGAGGSGGIWVWEYY